MANFDIITATSKAYKTTWMERHYLLKLAAIPTLVKLICYITAGYAGYDPTQLEFTLCLLPALFVEGWMQAHYVRLILLGHRWPFKGTGDVKADMPMLRLRARGVMGGLLMYVLVSMGIAAFFVGLNHFVPAAEQNPEAVTTPFAMASVFVLLMSIWGVRLAWLHIPYSVNMDAKSYLGLLGGYFSSLPMIAVWILCTMPFLLVLQFIKILIQGSGAASPDASVLLFCFMVLLVAMDTIKNLVAVAGITHGFQEILNRQKQAGL